MYVAHYLHTLVDDNDVWVIYVM